MVVISVIPLQRNNVMEVFLNTDEDSELRITAYLAVMQCPVQTFLDQVRSRLESERADQVGSFVWSHLINLMDTASPLKQNIREILEDEELKKDFDLDKRKFSRCAGFVDYKCCFSQSRQGKAKLCFYV